jgi:pimeloyl-[acyl-carrier protein] methyl ester esterase
LSLDALVLLPGLDGTGTLFADLVSELPRTLKINIARYPTETFLSYSEFVPWAQEAIPSNSSFLAGGPAFCVPQNRLRSTL